MRTSAVRHPLVPLWIDSRRSFDRLGSANSCPTAKSLLEVAQRRDRPNETVALRPRLPIQPQIATSALALRIRESWFIKVAKNNVVLMFRLTKKKTGRRLGVGPS